MMNPVELTNELNPPDAVLTTNPHAYNPGAMLEFNGIVMILSPMMLAEVAVAVAFVEKP